MKEIIIPFTVFLLVLLTGLAGFYFVSPAGQVSALQTENNLLKSQLAELQNDNQTDLVAVVIVGFLTLTIILLTGFFLLLCLLSGQSPVSFFRPSGPGRIQERDPASLAIEKKPTENINHYPAASDNYVMESLEVIL